MADAAASAQAQPSAADETIRVRVRQQEPAGEHDLSLPRDVRPFAFLRHASFALPYLSSRVEDVSRPRSPGTSKN
jgi:hypothetical protein